MSELGDTFSPHQSPISGPWKHSCVKRVSLAAALSWQVSYKMCSWRCPKIDRFKQSWETKKEKRRERERQRERDRERERERENFSTTLWGSTVTSIECDGWRNVQSITQWTDGWMWQLWFSFAVFHNTARPVRPHTTYPMILFMVYYNWNCVFPHGGQRSGSVTQDFILWRLPSLQRYAQI